MDTRLVTHTADDATIAVSGAAGLADALAEGPDGGQRLWEDGIRRIRVDGPVRATLPFLRSLRDATGHGLLVTWDGTIDDAVEVAPDTGADAGSGKGTGSDTGAGGGRFPASRHRRLYHLPPPISCLEREWITTYRYGLCYFRVGPAFLTVVDQRDGPSVPAVLRDPEEIEILRELAAPKPMPATPALSRLLRRGLVIRHGADTLRLPYRLIRWPIPCTAI
jgi:Family of unknown function (DUF5825)